MENKFTNLQRVKGIVVTDPVKQTLTQLGRDVVNFRVSFLPQQRSFDDKIAEDAIEGITIDSVRVAVWDKSIQQIALTSLHPGQAVDMLISRVRCSAAANGGVYYDANASIVARGDGTIIAPQLFYETAEGSANGKPAGESQAGAPVPAAPKAATADSVQEHTDAPAAPVK